MTEPPILADLLIEGATIITMDAGRRVLGDGALANLRMAMDAFPNQGAGHLLQHGARLFGQSLQHAAGNPTHRRILHGVKAVGQHNPCAIGRGKLAGILQSRF